MTSEQPGHSANIAGPVAVSYSMSTWRSVIEVSQSGHVPTGRVANIVGQGERNALPERVTWEGAFPIET